MWWTLVVLLVYLGPPAAVAGIIEYGDPGSFWQAFTTSCLIYWVCAAVMSMPTDEDLDMRIYDETRRLEAYKGYENPD